MKKYQCYYNETISCNGREYIGKRVDTECFDTEEEAIQCFEDIVNGNKRPFDFVEKYTGTLNKKDIRKCLE